MLNFIGSSNARQMVYQILFEYAYVFLLNFAGSRIKQ